MRKLVEKLASHIDTPELLESNQYSKAKDFFEKGILPDGSKWHSRPVVRLGLDNSPVITKVKKKQKGDVTQYSFRVRFAPGKGGSGGAGIDPVASNQFFSLLGTSKKDIREAGKAYSEFVKKRTSKLNDALRVWMLRGSKGGQDFKWRLVGWQDRDNYTIDNLVFKGIKYEAPMVDPTRRKWPAGRTEIWAPVIADVIMTLKSKV
jgi:hypothetical protein